MRRTPLSAPRTRHTGMVLVGLLGGLVLLHGTTLFVVTLGLLSHRATQISEAEKLELVSFKLRRHDKAPERCVPELSSCSATVSLARH